MPKGNLAEKTIDQLTTGIVNVDVDHKILGYNQRFEEWFSSNVSEDSFIGLDFYKVIGNPFFFDGVYAPLHYARATARPTRTVIGELDQERQEQFLGPDPKIGSCKRVFALLVTPVSVDSQFYYRVELTDLNERSQLEQRLDTLKSAGTELTEMPDQNLESSETERKRRLIELIEKHMLQTLKYDVFEIRILEPGPEKRLLSFLSFGINPNAVERELRAESNNNGITGYVADSGEPYICDDVKNDAHYQQGAIDARSSLTVPLFYNNKVIGVCNVESRQPHAFSRIDETFLQLYARDLALALHHHQAISARLRGVQQEYGKQIEERLGSISSNLFSNALELLASQGDSSADGISQIQSKLIQDLILLKLQVRELAKHFLPQNKTNETLDFPKEWQDVVNKYSHLVNYIKDKRFLLVSSDDTTAKQLEKLGGLVDVVHTTRSALQALRLFDYVAVITDKNPDGYYFNNVTARIDLGLNPKNWSVYDIHEGDDYFIPIEGDEADRLERERVYREITQEQKLDAYFLKQAIDSLGLERTPILIIQVLDPLFYDPTHIVRSLKKLNEGTRPLMFNVNHDSPNQLLKILEEALLSVSKGMS